MPLIGMVFASVVGHQKPSPMRCVGKWDGVGCGESDEAGTDRRTCRAVLSTGSASGCWICVKRRALGVCPITRTGGRPNCRCEAGKDTHPFRRSTRRMGLTPVTLMRAGATTLTRADAIEVVAARRAKDIRPVPGTDVADEDCRHQRALGLESIAHSGFGKQVLGM
jgi:hypothetical protein